MVKQAVVFGILGKGEFKDNKMGLVDIKQQRSDLSNVGESEKDVGQKSPSQNVTQSHCATQRH